MIIFHNPASSFINVRINISDAHYIYVDDIYGNLRLQVVVNSDNQIIQVSDLNTGTYLLHVLGKAGNMIATEKFMKK